MTALSKIKDQLEPFLRDMGYTLVQVTITDAKNLSFLILIDRLDEAPVKIQDCERVSRAIQPFLKTHFFEDILLSLDIASPGLDRPLFSLKDYTRFIGHDVTLKLKASGHQPKRLDAKIQGVHEQEITLLTTTGEECVILFDEIEKGHLDPSIHFSDHSTAREP